MVHKSLSSFEGAPLNVISSLWEEITQGKENLFADAHEDDVWHWLISLIPINLKYTINK